MPNKIVNKNTENRIRGLVIVALLVLITVAGFCGYITLRQDIAEREVRTSRAQDEIKSLIARDQIRQKIEGDACHTKSHQYAEIAYPRSLYPDEDDRSMLMTEYKQVFTANYCL